MKKLILIFTLILLNQSCNFEKPTEFTEEVLKVELTDLKDSTINFETILAQHKGQKILIDVWASWCRDCIEGMPVVKELQTDYPNVAFVFLSLDRSIQSWKNGIQRYEVKGNHYFLNSGWDGQWMTFLILVGFPDIW